MPVFQVNHFSSTAGEQEVQMRGSLAQGTKQLEAEVVQRVTICLTNKTYLVAVKPCNIVKR